MNLDVTPVPSSIVPRRRRAVWAGTCAVGAFLVAACATLAPHFATPRLSLTGIELLGGNLFQQDFRLGLRIDNPNSGALPIERVRARLRLGGQQVATGTSMQAFVVPPHGAARVVWAGLDDCAPLRRLAAAIDEHLAEQGVARETRAFQPHLTLARAKKPADLQPLRPHLSLLTPDWGQQSVGAFCLSLSRPLGGEYQYEKLQTFPLQPELATGVED